MSRESTKIGLVGLGYVGLPVAAAMASRFEVTGFDLDAQRVEELRRGFDATREVASDELSHPRLRWTTDPAELRSCNFIIIAVPTPVDATHRPDLRALELASRTVGAHLSRGTIVVFESTVYPGVTEEICLPLLEGSSGLRSPVEFQVGYSPERINPGDREHSFRRIRKVVAGQTPESLERIAEIYDCVVDAGVHRVSSIRVAEAAKVIENTQRDLNIALMNELALIFRRMGLDTGEVLEAASTKWNFLPFRPGLVGGHCIGVDPYFLTHKAEELGYHPQVILAGRRINDGMGEWVADQLILELVQRDVVLRLSKVAVLGVTFKENVPDMRNSGVIRVITKLRKYGLDVRVHDPIVNAAAAAAEGIDLVELEDLKGCAAVVLAVAHREFVEGGWGLVSSMLESGEGLVMDVRAILDRALCPHGVTLWRL